MLRVRYFVSFYFLILVFFIAPPRNYQWVEKMLPETTLTRTKECQMTVKLNEKDAPLEWYHGDKLITVLNGIENCVETVSTAAKRQALHFGVG